MESLEKDILVDMKSVSGEEAAVHVKPLQNHPTDATTMLQYALQTNLQKGQQWLPHHLLCRFHVTMNVEIMDTAAITLTPWI